jgi:hypothetical protein
VAIRGVTEDRQLEQTLCRWSKLPGAAPSKGILAVVHLSSEWSMIRHRHKIWHVNGRLSDEL